MVEGSFAPHRVTQLARDKPGWRIVWPLVGHCLSCLRTEMTLVRWQESCLFSCQGLHNWGGHKMKIIKRFIYIIGFVRLTNTHRKEECCTMQRRDDDNSRDHMWGRGGERWEQNREEGVEQGEEMHAALLNSSFFSLPFNPLHQVFFSMQIPFRYITRQSIFLRNV